MVEDVEEDLDLRFEEPSSFTTIILDSGADAPIFPAGWLSAGTQVPRDDGPRRLQDAQGNVISSLGKREVEIFLRDRVTQPILCYGKLMEQGRNIKQMSKCLSTLQTTHVFQWICKIEASLSLDRSGSFKGNLTKLGCRKLR